MDLKNEISEILSNIFGNEVKKIVDDHYNEKNPHELIELAYHMLTGFMGKKKARDELEQVLTKYPKFKIKLD